MCQCNPAIRTPWCGKGNCVNPDSISPEDPIRLPLAPLAVRISSLRIAKGWTQTVLAEKCGLEPSAISHFECNRREPSLSNIVRLVEALECDAGYLIGTSNNFTQRMQSMDSALRAIMKLAISSVGPLACAEVGWLAMKGLGELKP